VNLLQSGRDRLDGVEQVDQKREVVGDQDSRSRALDEKMCVASPSPLSLA
jgi:hypothetical protein